MSDLTCSTISCNYSTELLRLPWSFPTGCFPISLQKCEFKSIGNRKWAWVVYLVSLASPNDPDLEWKPRPQLVGSAEAIRTTSSSSKWLFEAFLHVILFNCFCCWCFWKLRFRVSIWRRDECTANICQQTIQHLGISTFLFSSGSHLPIISDSRAYTQKKQNTSHHLPQPVRYSSPHRDWKPHDHQWGPTKTSLPTTVVEFGGSLGRQTPIVTWYYN